MMMHNSIRTLDAAANLESLKKEAKRWHKSLRDGDPMARERLRRVVPTADETMGLREVQHALALEYGATGWSNLKELIADKQFAKRSAAERADEFLRSAIDREGGDLAMHILRKHPDIARFNIHTAEVSGDLPEVRRRIELDPSIASSVGGPKNWQALQYLCYARTPEQLTSDNAVAIARALLDAGADPNATFKDDWNNPFTLITGVIGEGEQLLFPHPHAAELVQLLLDRGADPYDTQSLYNTSLHQDDISWLDILYSRSTLAGTEETWRTQYGPVPENSMMDYLLGNAVSRNHLHRAQWLLDRGARATAPHSYSKRNLHTEALLFGFIDMAALLERHGTQPEALNEQLAFQAACMRGDRDVVEQAINTHPNWLHDPTALFLAADHDRIDIATMLLDLGMSPNVGNGSWTALHSAACNNSLRVARLLIDRGAAIDARETRFNATPLGHAVYARKQAMVKFLSAISHDVFALVDTGNLERLREILNEQPSAIHATLSEKSILFFLSAPEDRASEIAELLLAHGVDPKARDDKGMTAGEVAAKRGFDDLAELLSDACVGQGLEQP